MAVLTLPPAAVILSRAVSRSTPVAYMTIFSARLWSFSLVCFTSTIRF